MRIYTRTGDDGSTGLGDGSRVPKEDPRVEAYGCVDELNSAIGVLRAESLPGPVATELASIQEDLFELGADLSTPERNACAKFLAERSQGLEAWMDRMDEQLEPLRAFILPAGTRSSALAQLARSICRRAERRVCAIDRDSHMEILRYLNRLSDALFVLARSENARSGEAEVLWKGRGS